jgi:hypothetical protein
MALTMNDQYDIISLYSHAIHLFDRGDMGWLDFWADEPEFTFPADPDSGRPEMKISDREGLANMVSQAHAMMGGKGLHHFTNYTFNEVDGGVRVRAYLMLVVNGATMMEPALIRQNTRIDDIVVKQNGKWLFKRRCVGATW